MMNILNIYARTSPRRLRNFAGAGLHVVNGWFERSARRRELARLDAFRLKDVGLSEQERACECRKFFWQS